MPDVGLQAGLLTKYAIPSELFRDQTPKSVAIFGLAWLLWCKGFVSNWDGSEWEMIFGCYQRPAHELVAELIAAGRSEDELRRLSRDGLVLERLGRQSPLVPIAEAPDFLAALAGLESLWEGAADGKDWTPHFLTVQRIFEEKGLMDYDSDDSILV